MTFFCANSVQAEVLYNEATDSYTSTSEEDGTIAINGSVYDSEGEFYGMSSDEDKKYLENIVPTVDDSVQFDKKVKSKNLAGFKEENGENVFGESTFVYEYTPENPYLVFKWTKGDKKMDSVNIAIRIKNT